MKYIVSRVQFTNPERLKVLHNDETEFDTTDERELAELWWEFCKENGLIDVSQHIVRE